MRMESVGVGDRRKGVEKVDEDHLIPISSKEQMLSLTHMNGVYRGQVSLRYVP